jgi:hypothetical protein
MIGTEITAAIPPGTQNNPLKIPQGVKENGL